MGISRAQGVEGYAKREGKGIYVRGSVYAQGWTNNAFTPDEALEFAAHLTKLANEADKPVFVVGQAYMDADGDVFIRYEDEYGAGWIDAAKNYWSDLEDFPNAPIVLLVPETEVK